MSFLYFAYGSNMLPARLRARCASARSVGRATAVGFDLAFSKPSIDQSGKATLIESDHASTAGVLFEIATDQLDALNRAEGSGYDRADEFVVKMALNERVRATTYVASAINPELKPYDWYLALVIAGAIHHELDEAHVRRLQAVEYLFDDHESRASRRRALEVLLRHGFDNHRTLLTGSHL